MSHKRFVFDDEIEDLQPSNIKEDTSKSLNREEKPMKKSKQKKKSKGYYDRYAVFIGSMLLWYIFHSVHNVAKRTYQRWLDWYSSYNTELCKS